MKKKIISFLCILSLTLAPIYASELSDKKDELDSTQDSIEQAENDIEENQQQQQQVSQEIAAFDTQIMIVENEILEVEQQLEKKEEEIAITMEELEVATDKRDYQYEATKERMVDMYKNSKTGYMEVILTSENVVDLLNRAQYVKVISEYDNNLIKEYQYQQEVIEEKKEILEEEQQNIQVLYDEQMSNKEYLDSLRAQKNTQLGVLQSQEGELNAQLEEMEKLSKQLEEEIKKLTEQNNQQYNGGEFYWPVPGQYRVSSDYYSRTNPITGQWEFHTGIDIPASYGVPVVAAADGVVIMSAWYGGYGNTVIIDHGSGITSLYAHNSSLTVAVGQQVKQGQQIAKIGSTGMSTGNHCHFEVRINGAHTSPWNYLKK